MTPDRPRLPSYPVVPTILVMICLALVGFFAWGTVTFAGNVGLLYASSPFALFMHGPALLVGYGIAAVVGVVAVPFWALGGGQLFAMGASGSAGGAARQMGVTMFSEAHPISRATQQLAERMGLPRIAYIGWFPNEEINAFAMGNTRRNALVAFSKGAIERLTKDELRAVIAHELGHVASNDMARMTHARSVQEALTFFLLFRGLKKFVRWIFTPLSELELLRMSRAREFTADRIAAIMLGPEPMIAALEKLRGEASPKRIKGHANVLMWSGFSRGSLFSTHPSLAARIARLQEFRRAFFEAGAEPLLPSIISRPPR